MDVRFSRLRWPEWMVGAGGLGLLGSTLGRRGGRWLTLPTGLAGLGVAFFQARERAPAIPVALTALVPPPAALSMAWLTVRVRTAPPGERKIGDWIGLLGAAAIAYGGYKSIKMEGIARADAPGEIPTIGLERAT